jgi:hypothetical protein
MWQLPLDKRPFYLRPLAGNPAAAVEHLDQITSLEGYQYLYRVKRGGDHVTDFEQESLQLKAGDG